MAIVRDLSNNNKAVDKHIPDGNNGALKHVLIVPSDTVAVPYNVVELRCDVAGTLTLVTDDGMSVLYNVVAGERIPVSPRYVKATGTTATGIVGWY